MRTSILLLGLFLLMVGMAFSQQVDRVIDGDTFVLKSGDKVRLIGVDAPETSDPNKPIEYFAYESAEFVRSLCEGKSIKLEYGDERTDKYGRLLCYIWVDDTVLVNHEIIKQGYGMAYLRFPHKWEDTFLKAEIDARRQAIGMWASPRSVKSTFDPNTVRESKGTRPLLKEEKTKGETVYITKSGSKYHRGYCGYLRKSKIEITKQDAIARGYGACKKCKP